ncbi:small hydrophilic protein [Streptomyces agglomeratus]|uniref:Small hydrophilic protein n=1 Tax=Streptomyces agglomeratus TaxID=285458 RepID=A0A1E5P9X1_9ACTN|nr:DUF6381 family protein [Streptomyces agglomeratus]OEJ26353.1 small hydrophilic protein [Streptomyces agglomeratus]OEJ39587.1 small hydrophilic protein [Streptomyces agglomeratus]OEJ46029.1 small hydrophilic protein [Streptomyces agglomeratus]OEJ52150.1 small hydrophilic protein [Streptomyces agglomeratus]OEJ59509.1 small hydrophilic protein [Streptomyces agglomeratus]
MSIAGESSGRVQQMREKAEQLKQAAERATDPQERQKLLDKADRLREQSQQEGRMGGSQQQGFLPE